MTRSTSEPTTEVHVAACAWCRQDTTGLRRDLAAAVRAARSNAMERDGAQEDVDRMQAAMIVADRAYAADVSRLRGELQQLQQLAAREAADLRAEVEKLRSLVDEALAAGAAQNPVAMERIRREAGLT